jgi:hypothetical protein
MDYLEIHDNFFPPEEIKTINEYLTRPNWSFNGGGSTEDNDFHSHFWHMDGLEKIDYFGKNLWEFIRRQMFGYDVGYKYSTPFYKDVELIRCYANGQTAGQSGVPHTDDGDTTILFFPNQWKHYWGGHLYFSKKNNFGQPDYIDRTVEYRYNRLIKFDANVQHYSGAPVLSYGGLRISLAFKVKVLS